MKGGRSGFFPRVPTLKVLLVACARLRVRNMSLSFSAVSSLWESLLQTIQSRMVCKFRIYAG